VNTSTTKKRAAVATAGFVSLGVAQVAAPAHATVRAHSGATSRTSTRTTASRTSSWTAHATKVGTTKASTQLQLAVWLKQRNAAGLLKRTQALYRPGSATYHQWLTPAQIRRNYSPTQHQLAVVKNYLTKQGLHVQSVAGDHSYVNVSGTAAQAQRAFGVSLSQYRYHGATYRGTTAPQLKAIAGGHIDSISGLDDASAYRPSVLRLGESVKGGGKPQPASSTTEYDGVCGDWTTQHTLDFINPTESKTLTGWIPCNPYNGAQLQKAYGVDQLPGNLGKTGADETSGAGQTIAIIDAYGSPTILQDANKFSEVAGLPPLNSSNFQVVSPKGIGNKKESKAQDPLGWQAEVTLDVEAAHAMAPGAKIVLVAAPNNYASLDEAVNWVTLRHTANIVSSSWGLSTDLMAPGQGSRDNRIFITAAAEGIGLNFSSGDNGDETYGPDGLTVDQSSKSVDFPASSPWVNSVGGTSLFLNEDNSYKAETGWGTTLNRVATCDKHSDVGAGPQQHCDLYDQGASAQLDEGFQGGAGGGLSNVWTAQPWQSAAIGNDVAAGFGTVGTHRAVPDIGMLADPYTGMGVWITDLSVGDTAPEEEGYGGTSLATPLFAGIMADVDQARAAAGHGPAGLASQYLYNLPAGAVRDVLSPAPTATDVTPPTLSPLTFGHPNSSAAAGPDSTALWYGSFHSGSLFDAGFNSDTSLDTAPGWDDVTGVGSPVAPQFVAALR
jgi:subtilase family serine protease